MISTYDPVGETLYDLIYDTWLRSADGGFGAMNGDWSGSRAAVEARLLFLVQTCARRALRTLHRRARVECEFFSEVTAPPWRGHIILSDDQKAKIVPVAYSEKSLQIGVGHRDEPLAFCLSDGGRAIASAFAYVMAEFIAPSLPRSKST